MKIGRIIPITLALAILALAVAVRLNPSLIILAARDVQIRSPFCSPWKASLDGHIKLRQEALTDEIAQSSRLVRRDGDLALWSTPRGEFWVPQGNDEIVPLLLAQEDRDIYGNGEWGVQPGDVVLDVGAYIGTWTKQALARGARRVIAIEPTPSSVECLKRNLAAEIAAGKVVIYPKGIWDPDGSLTLFANSKSGAGIPATTVDKLAAELGLTRVDFIKADVKGATERLLRGGSTVIRRDRPRLAFSTEDVADDAPAIAKLAQQIQPAYKVKCGPCLTDGKAIYTDVLFFR